jgi:hypothetical protein
LHNNALLRESLGGEFLSLEGHLSAGKHAPIGW